MSESREYKLMFTEGAGSDFARDRSALDYWLGPAVSFCEIAEYGFVQYEETDFHNGPNYGKLTGKTRWSIYINGHSISLSAASLDEALVAVIAYKRDGCNSQAAKFFMKATSNEVQT